LLLDTLRQYLKAGSETDAGAACLEAMAAQLLAAYLEADAQPARRAVLLGVLNAACTAGERTTYQVDESNRQLLRWHPERREYLPVAPALRPWLPVVG
jgi:hypothetical protein